MKRWPIYYAIAAIVLSPHLSEGAANVVAGVMLLAATFCLWRDA